MVPAPIHIPGKPPAGIGVKRNATAAHPSGDAGRETTLQAGEPSQHRDPAQGQGIPLRIRNARLVRKSSEGWEPSLRAGHPAVPLCTLPQACAPLPPPPPARSLGRGGEGTGRPGGWAKGHFWARKCTFCTKYAILFPFLTISGIPQILC